MKPFQLLLTAVFATFLSTAAPPLSADMPDSVLNDSARLQTFFDGVIEPLMKNNNSPSGVIAIAHNGRLVFAKGYGFQDVAEQIPVDPYTTLFRPGSVSKLSTWVAVMQQVEQGKLDLDTDVNTYLTDFKIKDTFDRPVTLRDIMTHSAGFEDGALGYLIITDPDKAIPLEEAMKKYQPERVNPPGAQTAYSNYATSLAGLLVEKVSGIPFNDYIRQNILEPLGMDHATFDEPLPENLADDMATSYKVEAGAFKEQPFEIISSFAPAGAESASGTDMVRFAQAILNGGELNGRRILQPETVKEMLTRQFTHDDRLMGMCLGFYEDDYSGTRVVGHGGDTQWFHSFLGVDQEHGLAFFASFGGTGGSTVRSSVFRAFYNEYFPRQEAPPVPPEDFAQRAGKYAGTYGFWRSNFSTIEKALGLSGGVSVTPTADNTLVVGFGGKVKQYVEVDNNLFRERSSEISLVPGISPRLLAFQENDSGAITGFVMDGLPFMSLRKLPFYSTPNFNFTLLGISMLVFLGVLARRFFQRKAFGAMAPADRSALRAAVWASALNWLVLLSGAIVLSVVMDSLFKGIPPLFKVWLVTPVLATVAGLYLLFRMFGVWRRGLLPGFWARLRYTIVAFSALFMCWFYWFWNILGWQYK
jgi:CubicO group peptidase (beta-lactamase class C family)